jgi:hypothetical protein
MDSVRVFFPSNGAFIERRAGDQLPYQAREVRTRDFTFRIPPGLDGAIYLRFATSGTMTFPLAVRSAAGFFRHISYDQLIHGLYYGIALGLLLYNIFLLIALRDKSYLFYVIYLVAFAMFQFAEDGLAAAFLWPDAPWWANRASPFFLGGALFGGLGFSRSFTSLRRTAPRLDRVMPFAMAAAVALSAASLLVDYRMVIIAGTALVFVVVGLVAAAALLSLKSGYRPARYFAAAWAVLIVTAAAGNSEVGGLLHNFFFSVVGVKIGAALELVLLSLALGDRINTLKVERALLAELATVDEKTALSNYRHLQAMLAQEVKRALRYRRPLALLMIDIDNFKTINDSHGHDGGDAVLVAVARALRAHCGGAARDLAGQRHRNRGQAPQGRRGARRPARRAVDSRDDQRRHRQHSRPRAGGQRAHGRRGSRAVPGQGVGEESGPRGGRPRGEPLARGRPSPRALRGGVLRGGVQPCLVAGAGLRENAKSRLRAVIRIGPRHGLKCAPLEAERDLRVDAMVQRNAVGVLLGGGQHEPREGEQARIEVDLSSSPLPEDVLDRIGGELDPREERRVHEPLEGDEEAGDRDPHFLVVIGGEGERERLADGVR